MSLRPLLAVLGLVAALAAVGCNSEQSAHTAGGASPDVVRPGDPWASAQVIEPAALAAQLGSAGTEPPVLLHVGFKRLFDQGGIPGSQYAGPGQTPEGLALLQQVTASVPKDKPIVVYCGCCPWKDCPNMAPAFRQLADAGYTNVRALHVAKNFTEDWVEQGYPVDTPQH